MRKRQLNSGIDFTRMPEAVLFEHDGIYGDELWVNPDHIKSSKQFFSEYRKCSDLRKIVFYPFLSRLPDRKRNNDGWYAIVLNSAHHLQNERVYILPEVDNMDQSYQGYANLYPSITFTSFKNNEGVWFDLLNKELSSLTLGQKEEYALSRTMYIPIRRFQLDAQSLNDEYGRTSSYYVSGIYFKPLPENVRMQLIKNGTLPEVAGRR